MRYSTISERCRTSQRCPYARRPVDYPKRPISFANLWTPTDHPWSTRGAARDSIRMEHPLAFERKLDHMTNASDNSHDGSPTFDRGAESAARLVLALVPFVGPVLAEAVGYSRSVYDAEQDAAFRAEVRRRLATLESSESAPPSSAGTRSVKISGD